MEPIKTAPKDGGPVWAQIADFMTEEEISRLGIELTPFTTRETRRTWIYWAEPGLPSCNPGGHWAVVSPDFEIRRYNFFCDGWFPQFTPARAPQDAKPDVEVLNPVPSHQELLALMSPQLRKDLGELCRVYQEHTAPTAGHGIVRCVINTQLAEWAVAVLERYDAAVDFKRRVGILSNPAKNHPVTPNDSEVDVDEDWAYLEGLLNPGEKPPSCS